MYDTRSALDTKLKLKILIRNLKIETLSKILSKKLWDPKIVSQQMKVEPKRVLTKEEDPLTTTKRFESTIEDLLRECEPEKMTLTKEDQEWINSSPACKEVW